MTRENTINNNRRNKGPILHEAFLSSGLLTSFILFKLCIGPTGCGFQSITWYIKWYTIFIVFVLCLQHQKACDGVNVVLTREAKVIFYSLTHKKIWSYGRAAYMNNSAWKESKRLRTGIQQEAIVTAKAKSDIQRQGKPA